MFPTFMVNVESTSEPNRDTKKQTNKNNQKQNKTKD